MEIIKYLPKYRFFRRWFFGYQFIGSALLCMPAFLSLILLIGIPHVLFLTANALNYDSYSNVGRKILHGMMFPYYAWLFYLSLLFWPEFAGTWEHADSIDNLIRLQLLLAPLVLFGQLILIAIEWIYPTLLPHEKLDQITQAPYGN